MPITPAKLKQRRKAITFDYGGDPAEVEYYPAAVTSDASTWLKAWGERATAAKSEEEGEALLLEFGEWGCSILAKWNYCEDSDPATPDVPGPMVPITPERLAAEVDTFSDFIMEVFAAIFRDRFQGNANGTPSSAPSAATSSPTESSASMTESLNRSTPSSSPVGSAAAGRRSTGS